MKQRNLTCSILLTGLLLLLFSCKEPVSELSLAGEWRFALDPQDVGVKQEWQKQVLGETLRLPGSLQEQGKGEDVGLNTQWTGQIVDSSWYKSPAYAEYRKEGNIKVPFWLNPDKHYVGVAWYQKEVVIPSQWKGQRIALTLERPHIETTVWVGKKKIGMQNSLSVPHVYDLTGAVQVGKTCRITTNKSAATKSIPTSNGRRLVCCRSL